MFNIGDYITDKFVLPRLVSRNVEMYQQGLDEGESLLELIDKMGPDSPAVRQEVIRNVIRSLRVLDATGIGVRDRLLRELPGG